jgi:hypothetical protein
VAVGVAVAVAVPVALEVAVAVDVGCSSVVAGWVLSTVVVRSLVVCSLGARGSDGEFVAAPVRSSTKAESNVERVRAATIAPTSTTGASTTVKGNNAHGEWPT